MAFNDLHIPENSLACINERLGVELVNMFDFRKKVQYDDSFLRRIE